MASIQVLVIDDEVPFARNLVRLLNHRGFSADAAFSGAEAVEAAVSKSYHAALLDVRMPGMDGIETLLALKRKTPAMEVIMLTGQADVETGIEAIRAGAYDYLFKPCDIDMLTAKIRETVAAEAINRHPVIWPRRVVKEISDAGFLRLETGDPLSRALDIFNALKYAGPRDELHVTDRQDRLQGLIGRSDLLAAAQQGRADRIDWSSLSDHPQWLPPVAVAEVMRPAPTAQMYARADEPLPRLAERMVKHNVRCLPVMDGNRLVGIVRFRDVLQHVSAAESLR